jgi:hypothetical protein
MNPLVVLAAIATLALVYVIVPVVLHDYRRMRGVIRVVCPETGSSEEVELHAAHAALSGFIGEPRLRLTQCSRWPDRQGCGQACLKQIHVADGCHSS